MNTNKETFTLVNQPEYHTHFWSYLMGDDSHRCYLDAGKKTGETFELPTSAALQFDKRLAEASLFRKLGTSLYAPKGPSDILAKVNTDSATWVAPGGEIPAYEGIYDFSSYKLHDHKLAVVIKMDASFLHDNPFIFESYLTDRLLKNFSKAEDDGFINGTGVDMPTGILADVGGADIGVTASTITYEDVVKLFFAVKAEYRKNGTWLMNSKTALALRTLKDTDGNYIWNHTNDTILGKQVCISDFMPSVGIGTKPIAFGDFGYYWVVDRSRMTVRTLRERFLQTEQIGYLAYELLDGQLIRPEAIQVLQVTAAQPV